MEIENKTHTIRNVQIMLDGDLAESYGVETRVLNQAVKRNKERFPEDFYFQINEIKSNLDNSNLKSQSAISSWDGTRKSTFAFTEQGVTKK